MRLFYAAFLSSENRQAYQALIDQLIQEIPGALRSVPPDTQHLTLAFLGEIPNNEVDACVEIVEAVAILEAFAFGLDRPRILMGRGRPRLICADVTTGREQVADVQALISARVTKQLPQLDLRPKPPHATLARFHRKARRSDGRRVERALLRHLESSAPRQDLFKGVHLVKSSLTPSGPVYETVAEELLQDRD